MIDVPRSLIFTDGFEMMMVMMNQNSTVKQRLQGLWWKRDPDVGGFVNLANTTGNSVKVRLEVIGAHGVTLPPQPVILAGRSPAAMTR